MNCSGIILPWLTPLAVIQSFPEAAEDESFFLQPETSPTTSTQTRIETRIDIFVLFVL
jgi:hypothetical protein